MKVLKQKLQLPIINHDYNNVDNKHKMSHRHGTLLPESIRCIICGPSGGGKTNILLSLLFDPNGLKFENIYIYCKSLYQPKYKLLSDVLQKIKGMEYNQYEHNEDVLDPKDAKNNSIFIFDDVIMCNQAKIRDYFCMGRHKNIDSFYLCQTYTKIPKHLIRDNANLLVILKQDLLNLKHVYEDHVGADMKFEQFCEICQECWKNQYGFLVICKDNELNKGRYRKGFDHFIQV